MGMKKVFTLLLCALLIVTTFGMSMAFANDEIDGQNGTGGQQVIIHEAGKVFKNGQEMWLHFDSGDVRGTVQGSTITALIGHNNGINKGTEVEFTLIPSGETGVIIISPHEGNDAGTDNIFHFDKGTNNYDGTVTFDQPEPDKGNLEITKISTLDKNKTFTFEILKNGEVVKTVYIDASNGKNGSTIVNDLDVGSYTIREAGGDEPGYDLNVTGTMSVEIIKDETATATITNTYTEKKDPGEDPEPKTGEVVFDKVISGQGHNDGLPASFTFNLKKTNDASVVYTATVEFDNAGTETVKFADIPIGEYYLTEVEDANWSSDIAEKEIIVKVEDDGKDGVNVTINGKNNNSFKVTNTYNPNTTGNLVVNKQSNVKGTFLFKVTKVNLMGDDIVIANPERADGLWEIDVTKGNLKGKTEISGLSKGYYFVEEMKDGLAVDGKLPATYIGTDGFINPDEEGDSSVPSDYLKGTVYVNNTGKAEIYFNNVYPDEECPTPMPYGYLKITKASNWAEGKTFTFEIKGEDYYEVVTITTEKDVNGVGTVGSETIVLPTGEYTISEKTGDAQIDGYKLSSIIVGADKPFEAKSFEIINGMTEEAKVMNIYTKNPGESGGGDNETPPGPNPGGDKEPPTDPSKPIPPEEELPTDPTEPEDSTDPDDSGTMVPDEHLPSNPTNPGQTVDVLPDDENLVNPDQPKTDDSQNLMGWMSLTLTALAALGVTIAVKRKEEK